MHRSFLDTRTTQAHLTGQLGWSKSFLEHLVLRYLIATLLALTFSEPMAISAQTHDKEQTRSDAEALAEAARLNEEVVRLYQVGRANEALPLAKSALAIREKVFGPNHPETATSLNNLGMVLFKMGDLKGARPHLERALEITEKVRRTNHPDTAQSLNNLGVLHQAMGDLKGAKPYLERALGIREKVLGPEHPDTAISLNNLGALHYAMGNLQSAQRYYDRSLTIRQRILGSENPETAESLNNIGNLIYAMGDINGAKTHLERALAIRLKVLGPEHPDTAISLNNLGILLKTTGDLKDAQHYYEYALAIRLKVLGPEHPDTAMSLNSLSVLFEAMGDIGQAIGMRERALNAEEHALGETLSIGTEQEKQSYLQMLLRSTHAAVSLHVQTAPQDAGATRVALISVLRRKGRALDATVESLRLLREHLSSQDRTLFDRLARLRAERAYLLIRSPEELEVEARRARLAELDPQISKIEAQLSAASAAFQQAHIPVTLEAVQARIPVKTALVEFFVYKPYYAKARDFRKSWGEPHYVAYVLHGTGEPTWVSLGEARRIEAAAEAFRRSVAERRGDVRQRGHDLDALILGKVRPLLGEASTLLISPDGALNLVPFAALVDERGQYLIERYRLSYLTSGRDWVRVAAEGPAREAPLILGDAAFEGTFGSAGGRGETKRAADMGSLRFGPLPGTAKEVRAIGEILGLPANRILTKEAATEGAVKGAKGPRILHLATHGFFLPDLPAVPLPNLLPLRPPATGGRLEDPLLRSGLALSGFNRRQEAEGANDGVLTALEVLGLDLWGTEVVALSACETGVGEVRAGEGVFGLRRALVLAGSQSQLMTLWQVADEPTQELMVSWYSQLQQGVGRVEALHQVQLAALRGKALPVTNKRLRGVKVDDKSEQVADPRIAGTRHPYYWASFILSGATGPISGGK